MAEFVKSNRSGKEVRIRFVGSVDKSVFECVKKYKLEKNFQHIQNVPHKEVPKLLFESHILYLPLDNSLQSVKKIPAKVFEYLAAQRPILLIQKRKSELEGLSKMIHAITIDKSSIALVNDLIYELSLMEVVSTLNLHENYERKNQTLVLEKLILETVDK